MTSEQKYEGKGDYATPRSTNPINGLSAEPTVELDPQTAKAPPAWVTPPALNLMYQSFGHSESDAMLVFRALSDFRQDRLRWLVKHILKADGNVQHTDSGSMLDEVAKLDQLIEDLVIGFQLSLDHAIDRVSYVENPVTYMDRDSRSEEVRKQSAADLTEFLS